MRGSVIFGIAKNLAVLLPHPKAACLDLAIRRAAFLPGRVDYLGGVAAVTLGRTARTRRWR